MPYWRRIKKPNVGYDFSRIPTCGLDARLWNTEIPPMILGNFDPIAGGVLDDTRRIMVMFVRGSIGAMYLYVNQSASRFFFLPTRTEPIAVWGGGGEISSFNNHRTSDASIIEIVPEYFDEVRRFLIAIGLRD